MDNFGALRALRTTMMDMDPEGGAEAFDTYLALCAGEEVEGVESVCGAYNELRFEVTGGF